MHPSCLLRSPYLSEASWGHGESSASVACLLSPGFWHREQWLGDQDNSACFLPRYGTWGVTGWRDSPMIVHRLASFQAAG